jgi:hypothetical protein
VHSCDDMMSKTRPAGQLALNPYLTRNRIVTSVCSQPSCPGKLTGLQKLALRPSFIDIWMSRDSKSETTHNTSLRVRNVRTNSVAIRTIFAPCWADRLGHRSAGSTPQYRPPEGWTPAHSKRTVSVSNV